MKYRIKEIIKTDSYPSPTEFRKYHVQRSRFGLLWKDCEYWRSPTSPFSEGFYTEYLDSFGEAKEFLEKLKKNDEIEKKRVRQTIIRYHKFD